MRRAVALAHRPGRDGRPFDGDDDGLRLGWLGWLGLEGWLKLGWEGRLNGRLMVGWLGRVGRVSGARRTSGWRVGRCTSG